MLQRRSGMKMSQHGRVFLISQRAFEDDNPSPCNLARNSLIARALQMLHNLVSKFRYVRHASVMCHDNFLFLKTSFVFSPQNPRCERICCNAASFAMFWLLALTLMCVQAFCDEEVSVDVSNKLVRVSRIFLWYGCDFGDGEAAVLRRVCEFMKEGSDAQRNLDALLKGGDFKVVYNDYDWATNSV